MENELWGSDDVEGMVLRRLAPTNKLTTHVPKWRLQLISTATTQPCSFLCATDVTRGANFESSSKDVDSHYFFSVNEIIPSHDPDLVQLPTALPRNRSTMPSRQNRVSANVQNCSISLSIRLLTCSSFPTRCSSLIVARISRLYFCPRDDKAFALRRGLHS